MPDEPMTPSRPFSKADAMAALERVPDMQVLGTRNGKPITAGRLHTAVFYGHVTPLEVAAILVLAGVRLPDPRPLPATHMCGCGHGYGFHRAGYGHCLACGSCSGFAGCAA